MNPSGYRDELTCWRAIVADRCAGAAPVLVGRLGGQAQRAATSAHVVHVIISLIHEGGGGEAGVDPRLVGDRAGHHSRHVVHLVRPLPEWHHLKKGFESGQSDEKMAQLCQFDFRHVTNNSKLEENEPLLRNYAYIWRAKNTEPVIPLE